MRELFNEFVTLICVGGLSLTALAMFVLATFPTAAEKVGKPLAQAVRNRRLSAIIPIICVCAGVAYGTIKNNSGTNGPAPQMMSMRLMAIGEVTSPSLQNEDVSNSFRSDGDVASPGELALVGNWCHRGAWQSGHILTFDADWTFPYATNHLTRVEIWSTGVVYPSEQDPTPIVQLATPFAIKPMETRVLCGRTTNNTYRIEWQGAYPNRDTTQIADAAIELHRNGDVIVTEGGITSDIPYAIPFAHDGFGQDEDWVRANFTNAEEIRSVGYANWVNAQVGVGLTNGLYKFTATFDDYPLEATQLYVGDYSVCVTNAGEYTFVLEKGSEYEFGTWPYDDAVEYCVEDDLGSGEPMLMSWWGGEDAPGEWSIDGGWLDFYWPGLTWDGYCCWMPTLQGSPNLSHLGPDCLPQTFVANLTDYPSANGITYLWSTANRDITISAPHDAVTQIYVQEMPDWNEFDLSVTATISGHELYSSIQNATYGYDEERPASCDILSLNIVTAMGGVIRWGDIVLVGESVRVVVGIDKECDSVSGFVAHYAGCVTLRTFSTDESGERSIVSAQLPMSEDCVNMNSSTEFVIEASAEWLQSTQLVSNQEDGWQEKTSIDNVADTTTDDQRTDSDTIDGLPGLLRGRVRGPGNEGAAIPEGMFNGRSLKAAGFARIEAFCRDVRSPSKPVQQQADFVYYSGHGYHAEGGLAGCSPTELAPYWTDVDTVVIAGCAVLDIKDYRANSFNPFGKRKWLGKGGACSPGERWENLSADVYLGYAWLAPLDSAGGNDIAARFKANVDSGQDYIIAWKNANDCDAGRNACAIDCRTTPHTYWFWSESLFGSSTWTSVQKGTSEW